ncbi:MAG: hypothetical protein WCE87_05680 [Candidatus Udaeobacter sp.]
MATRTMLFASLLWLAACAADRYQWNLAHETVNPPNSLPRPDVEEITRVVTRATMSPVFSIVRVDNIHGHPAVSVAAAATTGPIDDFMLEKINSHWEITDHGQQWDR